MLLPCNKCEDENYIQSTVIGYEGKVSHQSKFPKVWQNYQSPRFTTLSFICHAFNRNVNLLLTFSSHKFLCEDASRDGMGICFGDSGSPLIVQRRDGQQIVVEVSALIAGIQGKSTQVYLPEFHLTLNRLTTPMLPIHRVISNVK